MEQINIIYPSAVLASYVKHYWLMESNDITSSQRIIPTGNIELIFFRGSSIKQGDEIIPVTSLSGQCLSFAEWIPTGKIDMISVVFHPFGARAFFDMPAYELHGLIVSADDLNIPSLKELEDRIFNANEDSLCIQLIESFLISQLKPFKEYNYKRMAAAINAINLSGKELSVSYLAETIALSKKQFQRIFCEHVGMTPKEFMRIMRFHKALCALQKNPTKNFMSLACECGYYDQAHMANEFKFILGYTPTQYVEICTQYRLLLDLSPFFPSLPDFNACNK